MVDQKKERANHLLNWYVQRVDQRISFKVREDHVRFSIYRDKVLWLQILIFDKIIELIVFEGDVDSFIKTYSFEDTKECIDFLDSVLVLKDINND